MAYSDKWFGCVVGSTVHNINIPGSDTDIAIIAEGRPQLIKPKHYDIHMITPDTFVKVLVSKGPVRWMTQILFSTRFFSSFPVKDHFLAMNEDVVRAQAGRIYTGFLELSHIYEHFWRTSGSVKCLANSILYRSVLSNYAEGMPFAQAHRPEGELHDFLIGVRLGQVTPEEAAARNGLERRRAERAAGFYAQAVRPEILREFEQVIREEMEKEKR